MRVYGNYFALSCTPVCKAWIKTFQTEWHLLFSCDSQSDSQATLIKDQTFMESPSTQNWGRRPRSPTLDEDNSSRRIRRHVSSPADAEIICQAQAQLPIIHSIQHKHNHKLTNPLKVLMNTCLIIFIHMEVRDTAKWRSPQRHASDRRFKISWPPPDSQRQNAYCLRLLLLVGLDRRLPCLLVLCYRLFLVIEIHMHLFGQASMSTVKCNRF